MEGVKAEKKRVIEVFLKVLILFQLRRSKVEDSLSINGLLFGGDDQV